MFIEKLARLWSVDDKPSPRVDLIALLSFGATKDGLTKGAQATLEKTTALAAQHPKARVVFGVFTLSPVPGIERIHKKRSIKDPIFVGAVVSTIEEAETIRASLTTGFVPRHIVVVTDQWHSRSAKTVWKWVWRDAVPKPDIRVIAVPSSKTIDAASPMKLGRKHWTWALVNVIRQMFLVCIPGSIWLMKKLKLHQPTE